LLTPRTIQAHCTFLSPSSLCDLSQTQTSIAHCPLSNAYFSAKRFSLREAIDVGVKIGLGSDIAGGYELGIMNAMRMSVIISQLREGDRLVNERTEESDVSFKENDQNLSIDWKESLYLATKGGAMALGLPDGCGAFQVGAPFDAQLSKCIVLQMSILNKLAKSSNLRPRSQYWSRCDRLLGC
jgi:guanine deaminase